MEMMLEEQPVPEQLIHAVLRQATLSQEVTPVLMGSAYRNKGVQLLKLETLKPAATPPFENVRDLVSDKVHDARQQAEIRKFMARVRGQALIEWKNEALKKMYEAQVATDPAGGVQ
jgi:translation elongation factor EF-G